MSTSEMNSPLVKKTDVSLSRRFFQWIASGLASFGIAVTILEHHLRDRFDYSLSNVGWMLLLTAALCPVVKWLWFRFVGDRLSEYSLQSKICWHLGALLLGGWLTVVIPLTSPYSWADAVGIGFVALVVSAWMAKRPALKFDPNVSRWAWLGYALPPAVYWLYYLVVFWPAIISQDSVFQWHEMVFWKFKDNHPAAHTLTNWLLSGGGHFPAGIALAQIATLSLVIGLSLAWMRRHGMPRWLAITASCLLAIAPTNALLVITIWKDIFYCIAILAMVAALLAVVQTDGEWLSRRFSWLWLAIAASMIYLFRHNGPPVAAAILLALPVFYWCKWRPLLLSLATCALCVAMVKGPLYWAVGVRPLEAWGKASLALHHVSAHINAKTPLKAEERAVLNQIIPFDDDNPWPYNPYSWDSIVAAKNFNYAGVEEHISDLYKIHVALMLRRPEITLEHWKNSSRLVWQVRESPVYLAAVFFRDHRALRYDTAMLGAPEEKWIFEPIDSGWTPPPFIERSYAANFQWLTWRPALWMYLFFAGCTMAAIRARNWKYLLVALPIFTQGAIMTISSISPDFRYHWAVFLTGILMSGYLLFAIPRREAKPAGFAEKTSSEKSKIKGPHWQERDSKTLQFDIPRSSP